MWRVSANVSRKLPTLCQGARQVPSRSCIQAAKSPEPETAKPAAEKPPESTPPPPELPQKSGGGIFFKLLGLTLVAAGGTLGYAWYDPEFRKQLESTVPYSKDAFDAIIGPAGKIAEAPRKPQSSQAPGGPLISDIESVKQLSLQRKKVPESVAVPTPPLPAPTITVSIEKKTEETPEEKAPSSKKELDALKKEEAKRAAEEKKRLEQEKINKALAEKEADEAAENAALEAVLKGVLSEASEAFQTATDAHQKAADAVREHNRLLKQAMEMTDDAKDKEVQWQAVNAAFQTRQSALESLEKLEETTKFHLEKVRHAVKDGKDNKITKKNKALVETQEAMNSLNNNYTVAQREASRALSEAKIVQDFRNLVKKGRDQFKKELESIRPEVILPKKGGRLTEAEMKEELNLLIAHAHRRIDQLQCQLAEYQSLEQLHIQAALDKQKEEDDRLAQEMIKSERLRLESNFAVDKEKWDTEAQVAFERELRQQLTRQAAAHSDHLAEVLKVQERELQGKFQVLLQEELVKERDRFQSEVAGWVARLRGIEHAVEGRAELEKIGRKAQELWLACQALSASIASGTGLESEDGQLKPLANDLMAVRDAGNNHPFVEAVVSSVPKEAAARGVWTEEALQQRFHKVFRLGKRTALIDETGGSLLKFFLSYLQGLFVLPLNKSLQALDDVDPEGMDTFTILYSARRFVDEGDLEQAVRFMNQLKGEPRRVAQDWIEDARLLLEARQAADALLAHASAHGLGSLY